MNNKNTWTPLSAFKEPFSHRDGALTQDEFHQIIRYERLRADRTDSRFTLVNMELDFETVTRHAFRRFVATLFVKMRDIDQAGWFSNDTIGVLLPDTTISGAQTFMKSFHGYIHEFEIVKSVEFSMYPRVSNIKMVVDEEDEEPDYYSTYDNKLDPIIRRRMPVWKRTTDVLVSVLGLLITSPIFLILAVTIPLTSPGPLFYISERVGLGGRTFRMIKFRTLRADFDFSVPRLTYTEPLKATEEKSVSGGYIPGGQFLRRLGIDDLPQLVNVLQGEMSLIGPRPCLVDEAEIYLHWHKRRFDIAPGIIGLWQVSGKNTLSLQEKIRLDIRYSENMGVWMDLRICMMLLPSRFIEWRMRRRQNREAAATDDQSKDRDSQDRPD